MNTMRKACALTATLALFGAVVNAQAQSDTWAAYRDQSWPEHHMDGADYASSTYFTIHTPEQLAQFAWYVEKGNDFEGKTVTLANDYYADEFDMTPHRWVAAGSAAHPFCGVFEGNGKTVRGIKIHSASDAEYDGLFACVMAGAVIRNLRMADVDILTEPSPSAATYYPSVGALAGFMNGHVENCFVVNGSIRAVGKGSESDPGFFLGLEPGDPEPQGYAPIPSSAHMDRWFDAAGILCLAGNSTSKKAPVKGRYFVAFADGFWAENIRVKIAFASNNGKNGSYAIITEDGMQFFDASGTPRNDIVAERALINMSGVKGVIKNIQPKYTTHNWLAESFNGFWFTNPHGKGAMQAHLIWVDDGKGPRVTDPEENPMFLNWDNPSVNVGGLVGDFCLGGVTFLNCANGADVSASASDEEIFIHLGGIAGRTDMAFAMESVPVFRNCLNTGALSVVDSDTIAAAYVGGITGEIVEESECYVFQNCFNSGVIGPLPDSTLHSYAGGMVGRAMDYSGLTFESCYFWSARISPYPHGFVVGNRGDNSVAGTVDITFPGRPMLLPHEVQDTGDADKSGLHYWARTQPEGLSLYGGLYRGWTYDGTGVVNDGYPVLVDTFTGTKVTFHAQDGDMLKCQTVYTSFPDAAVYTYVLPLNNPVRMGYDFDGWVFKSTDGGGAVVGANFWLGSPTEVEAKWVANLVIAEVFLTEFIWVGETNIGYCVWHEDSPGCTNGAPICVYFSDEDGVPPHYGHLDLNELGNLDIILDDPIGDGLVGPHIGTISLLLNPDDPDGSKYKELFENLSDTVRRREDDGGGEDEQWINVGEIIIAAPATGSADVLLAWDTTQIVWYTPEFRAYGTIKYIVYTSPTLMLPVSEWQEQYETDVDDARVLKIGSDTVRDGKDGLWDQVKMLDSAKETARFYKVKAVKVLN